MLLLGSVLLAVRGAGLAYWISRGAQWCHKKSGYNLQDTKNIGSVSWCVLCRLLGRRQEASLSSVH